MKARSIKILLMIALVSVFSCNEPRTVVTDIVHTDGSVTRRIEIKNSENNFKISEMQVPFDETWTIRDSLEISDKGDTTYVKRAEKLFESVALLNETYLNDNSVNKGVKRHASFGKKFRWFSTEYRFRESADKLISFGYPLSDFLNKEELDFFYSPASLNDSRRSGPDSLRYKALEDTINKKTDLWLYKNVVAEWTGLFYGLIKEKSGKDMSYDSLKAREAHFMKIVNECENDFDSLWAAGYILKEFIGEQNAVIYKTEADSAMKMMERTMFVDFKGYTQRIAMPGRLTGTNGYPDSSHMLQWPVRSDYFVSEPYVMWAESKTTNVWAWIVTALFLVFVSAGLVMKMVRK